MLFLNSVVKNNNGVNESKETSKRFFGIERRESERCYICSYPEAGKLENPDSPFCDHKIIGHKNVALAELGAHLHENQIKIPQGYIVLATAYSAFLQFNKLVTPITQALEELDPDDVHYLVKITRRIRQWIIRGHFPADLQEQISTAYTDLVESQGGDLTVVARSSLTLEDIPIASFYSGQQSAYLNIQNQRDLLKACKHVFASLFSERAIAYCVHQGIDPMTVSVALGVQEMIRSDLAVSGVNFSLDPQTGFRNVVSISSSYGLGDNISKGRVNPDEFLVCKSMLEQGFKPIIKRQLGNKAAMTIAADGKFSSSITEIPVPVRQRKLFSLTEEEISTLAEMTVAIEQYYFEKENRYSPLSVEWAKDGLTGEIYVTQLCFESLRFRSSNSTYTEYQILESGWTLATGNGVGHKIVTGKARVVTDVREIKALQPGEILVVDETIPELEPYLNQVAAIVTDRGGRCCNSAAVAQEYDVPAVLGCGNATQSIKTGDEITVACIERNLGYVYEGKLAFKRAERPTSELAKTETDLMLSISNPEMAFEYASLPVDGAGVVKMEYVINSHIKVHPRALLEYEGQTPEVQFMIDDLVAGYPSRRAYYVDKLCEGISMIAAAFYPRPVMVRTSDFKSNEYAALYAGEFFEGHEVNPTLGLRGAARYFSPEFEESFALECEALRIVREDMGFTNVELIIPFVRTIEESQKITQLLSRFGLRRGENDLAILLMCETPANALLADEFLDYFDGLVIGADDLTQLTLGVDRESEVFQGIDERNKAVLKLMYLAIDACHRRGKYIGVSGASPSQYPELTRWLVGKDVDNITFQAKDFFTMQKVISSAELALDRSRLDETTALNLKKLSA